VYGGSTALLLLLTLSTAALAAETGPRRVRIVTSAGPFTVELDAERAPETVRRFLARAASYEGLALCESRPHGFFVFGCSPDMPPLGMKPSPPPGEPPVPDEIDAEAMGLGDRIIARSERDWLWQQEILPRERSLVEAERPVPPGLRALAEAARREGTAAFARLDGMSRKAYLEAIGYRFVPGASSAKFEKGALASANYWPGEADSRFLVALGELPERDGRATIFGRVVDGWGTLESIARIPVDKGHRPRTAVTLVKVETIP
jgi:cyclophilin family peptidyl-prolyl cis-trans isomerase